MVFKDEKAEAINEHSAPNPSLGVESSDQLECEASEEQATQGEEGGIGSTIKEKNGVEGDSITTTHEIPQQALDDRVMICFQFSNCARCLRQTYQICVFISESSSE